MAEFQWWLLILGLVVGGGIVATALLDTARRREDVETAELPAEAEWIADHLASGGRVIDPDAVVAVLRADREYRELPPPDRLDA